MMIPLSTRKQNENLPPQESEVRAMQEKCEALEDSRQQLRSALTEQQIEAEEMRKNMYELEGRYADVLLNFLVYFHPQEGVVQRGTRFDKVQEVVRTAKVQEKK